MSADFKTLALWGFDEIKVHRTPRNDRALLGRQTINSVSDNRRIDFRYKKFRLFLFNDFLMPAHTSEKNGIAYKHPYCIEVIFCFRLVGISYFSDDVPTKTLWDLIFIMSDILKKTFSTPTANCATVISGEVYHIFNIHQYRNNWQVHLCKMLEIAICLAFYQKVKRRIWVLMFGAYPVFRWLIFLRIAFVRFNEFY